MSRKTLPSICFFFDFNKEPHVDQTYPNVQMWVKAGKFSTWAGDCLVSITRSDQEHYYSSLSGMLVHRKVNPPPPSISLGFFDDSPKSIYTPRWRGALWVFTIKNKMRLRSFMKSSLKMSDFNFPGVPCRIWNCFTLKRLRTLSVEILSFYRRVFKEI